MATCTTCRSQTILPSPASPGTQCRYCPTKAQVMGTDVCGRLKVHFNIMT
jgi:hypothetical protein